MAEAIQVADNYTDDVSDQSKGEQAAKKVCKGDTTTYCYKGRTWTFPIQGVTKSDLQVFKDDKEISTFSVSSNSAGDTVITFQKPIQYSAYGGIDSDQVLAAVNSTLKLLNLQLLQKDVK